MAHTQQRDDSLQTLPHRQQSNPLQDAQNQAPWFSENYFTTRNPATRVLRKTYIKIITIMSTLVLVFMMGALSIYWGALYVTPRQAHNLDVWIVDSDGGVIGQTITQAYLNATGPKTVLHYEVAQPPFTDAASLEGYLVDERAWLIIKINEGASANLTAAAQSADASYNGTTAVTMFGNEARQENAYRSTVKPQAQQVFQKASGMFAARYATQLAAQGINVTALAVNAPSVLTLPISFVEANVRPFDVPVATAVDFVGLIYLLVLSFVISMIHWAARVEATHLEDHLSFGSLVATRILNPLIIYFFLSVFYALISYAFQTPFGRYYGSSGFVIYWMMCWMGMAALGLATESVITILTPRFIPFFLLLWIIANVSVAFFPIELLPGFYRYGYAMPFYNVSRTVRTIIFNTRNQIGLNFGVQFAWIAVSIAGIVLFQWIRYRSAKNARRELLSRFPEKGSV
ncbi:hypothetical protein PENSPDRAFT_744631 [Peniophora sp. CONT]|nr:hypothetical protein PENSPDRAFT_744631 [Peniophora sp. CONT]